MVVLAKYVLMGETSRIKAIGAFRAAHPLVELIDTNYFDERQ